MEHLMFPLSLTWMVEIMDIWSRLILKNVASQNSFAACWTAKQEPRTLWTGPTVNVKTPDSLYIKSATWLDEILKRDLHTTRDFHAVSFRRENKRGINAY